MNFTELLFAGLCLLVFIGCPIVAVLAAVAR